MEGSGALGVPRPLQPHSLLPPVLPARFLLRFSDFLPLSQLAGCLWSFLSYLLRQTSMVQTGCESSLGTLPCDLQGRRELRRNLFFCQGCLAGC